MLPTARSYVDMFDEEDAALTAIDHPTYGGIRLPDGRALAWSEYGSPRGVPCVLIPDIGSSRLCPTWLLHDSALPSSIRLLALDRPGIGHSDQVGLGDDGDPTDDLRHLVDTLAVGRVALIGLGEGADLALAFAQRFPELTAGVSAVAARLASTPARNTGWRRLRKTAGDRRHRLSSDSRSPAAAVPGWLAALGPDTDLLDPAVWEAALPRMSVAHRLLADDRWHEIDFRQSVLRDAEQLDGSWSGISEPSPRAGWRDLPAPAGVPVRFWHGHTEGDTTLASIREAADRPGWQVVAVASSSALMGSWPQILTHAASTFAAAASA